MVIVVAKWPSGESRGDDLGSSREFSHRLNMDGATAIANAWSPRATRDEGAPGPGPGLGRWGRTADDGRKTCAPQNVPSASGTNLGRRLFVSRQHSRQAAQRRARWAVEFCFGFLAFRSRSSSWSRFSTT